MGMTRITTKFFITKTQFEFHYEMDDEGKFYVCCMFPRRIKMPDTEEYCLGLYKNADENGNLYWDEWDNCFYPDRREEAWRKAVFLAFDQMPAVEEKKKLFEDMRQEFLAKRDKAVAKMQEKKRAANPSKSFGEIVGMVFASIVYFLFWVWLGVEHPKTACAAAILTTKKK